MRDRSAFRNVPLGWSQPTAPKQKYIINIVEEDAPVYNLRSQKYEEYKEDKQNIVCFLGFKEEKKISAIVIFS